MHGEELITRRDRLWALLLAVASGLRASSYILRPPEPDSLPAETYLTLISNNAWGLILIIASVALIIGAIFRRPLPLTIGAFISFCSYATFSTNLIVAVFQDSARAWAGIFPLVIIAVLHGELIKKTGPMLRNPQGGADNES